MKVTCSFRRLCGCIELGRVYELPDDWDDAALGRFMRREFLRVCDHCVARVAAVQIALLNSKREANC